ncbi:extracellular solute-binding protein [Fervidicoccus fontis]|uniref:ABC-type carbohydrate transport system, substrate-binding component n=1 Tax=Fervidicoccus fontis (strain DSM 19380 / JCM 18336 / VKM B-2539 / Kam940) TaxID=1163730 RepID=H9ZZI7_FERFK|nr:extracellular solute-binding protein [Fervidicoccus fontis]AFH42144.1 ABC-type carbohydrate transport system, substrate-binding component [Fervidicoccus fontis Kam940]
MGKKRAISTIAIIGIVIVIAVIGIVAYYAMENRGGTSPTTTTTTTSGLNGSLTVLVPSGDPTLLPYVQMVANDFMSKNPGVTIQVQPVPFGQLVSTALTSLRNQNPSPDLIIYYPSQASTLGPYLLDVRPYFTKGVFNLSDIPPSTLLPAYLLDSQGGVVKISGVPFQQVFGYVLIYQKSIFENQTLANEFKSKYGFDFDPTKWDTWDKLIDGAQFIQSQNITKYALLFPDGLTQSIFNGYVSIFYTYAINDPCTQVPQSSQQGIPVQGYWAFFKLVNKTIVPTINCTAGVQALETYKQLIQFQPPIDQQAMEYDQLRDLFLTGDYAMVAAWTSFIPIYNNASLSKVAGNIGIAPLPSVATGQAPTFIGINPNSKNPDLAADFIAFMTTAQEYKKGAELYGFMPATFSGMEVAATVNNTAWVANFIPLLKNMTIPNLQRMALVNYISNFFTDLRPIFINTVADYFRGKISAQDAVNYIEQQWINLMKVSS